MNNSNIIFIFISPYIFHISSATFNLSNHINILSRPPTIDILLKTCVNFHFVKKRPHHKKAHLFMYKSVISMQPLYLKKRVKEILSSPNPQAQTNNTNNKIK